MPSHDNGPAIRCYNGNGGRDFGPIQDGPEHSGFVILRLSPHIASEDDQDLESVARRYELRGLLEVLDAAHVTETRPVVRSLPPEQIRALEKRASRSELPPLRSLTSYWRIDMRHRPQESEEVVERLNRLPEVGRAYRERVASDPVVNAANDPYAANQGYLDPAPAGIDARWAWTQPAGEGAGIGVVDLEQGWFLTHEDYTSKAPTIIYGDNRDGVGTYVGNHGTAVLGEMIGDDNTVGVVGVAPSASSVRVTSHFDAATATALHVADAIVAAIPTMDPGDVLLLEVQRFFLPTETDDADFDAIRLASALGIIVVEAAGNGSNDLDAYMNAAGDRILDRTHADFRDSGAIVVGAAESDNTHDRANFSNFGNRVDCYAWGRDVVTCGYGDLDAGGGDDDRTYTDSFSGTSSASPIISGAAILLQGMYESASGTRMSPTQMRGLLSDPATGTPQGPNVAGNVGVMPDVRAIAQTTLGLVPDIYLRDNAADTGAVPSAGGISTSPDVIVRPSAVANPTASFGQGSGTENSMTLGSQVEAGQDNFIYVRLKNRGSSDATGVTCRVYWSEVSTLVTPDMWNLIGNTPPVDCPQGDTLVVTDALTWSAARHPGDRALLLRRAARPPAGPGAAASAGAAQLRLERVPGLHPEPEQRDVAELQRRRRAARPGGGPRGPALRDRGDARRRPALRSGDHPAYAAGGAALSGARPGGCRTDRRSRALGLRGRSREGHRADPDSEAAARAALRHQPRKGGPPPCGVPRARRETRASEGRFRRKRRGDPPGLPRPGSGTRDLAVRAPGEEVEGQEGEGELTGEHRISAMCR